MSTTPKKIVKHNSSCCWLCEAIVDLAHCKNIFHKKNVFFLSAAEEIHGSPLPRREEFLSLLCRPCERQLSNFKSFQQVIQKSQDVLELQFKRVIVLSPSALVTVKRKTGSAARRELDFPATTQRSQQVSQGEEVSFILKNKTLHLDLVFCSHTTVI